MTQAELAAEFAAMHIKGDPLVLYNIWDAGAARVIVEAGAKAVATGSWSVAASQGFEDGEELPLEMVLMGVSRICKTVTVPVSLDFEGAYAMGPTGVAKNVQRVLKLGVVGINFEDQMVGGKGLHKTEDQAKRIAAAREAADEFGVPMFINARTDVFLREGNRDWHSGLMPQALERIEAYAAAGANGIFVPGLADPELIRTIVGSTELPVNAMMLPDGPTATELAEIGVSRISYGPAPYRQAMQDLAVRYLDAISTPITE